MIAVDERDVRAVFWVGEDSADELVDGSDACAARDEGYMREGVGLVVEFVDSFHGEDVAGLEGVHV